MKSLPNQKVIIEVSSFQILKIIGLLIGIYLCYLLKDVIMLVFLAFILMAASRPVVVWLQNRFKIPVFLSALIVYFSVIFSISTILYFITQPLTSDFNALTNYIPTLIQKLSENFPVVGERLNGVSLSNVIQNVFSNLGSTFSNTVSITFSAFGALIQAVSMIILSLYLLLERDNTIKYFLAISRIEQKRFFSLYDRVEMQVGAWIRGQLLLCLAVGIVTYIGLTALGFKYALPLAVLAAIFEIIPFVGPILSAIPAVIIGFSISPVTGFLALLLTIGIQQLENNLLVPLIMKRAVGLSPVVTIISIMIGSSLLGILGSILAVPVAAVVTSLLNITIENSEAYDTAL